MSRTILAHLMPRSSKISKKSYPQLTYWLAVMLTTIISTHWSSLRFWPRIGLNIKGFLTSRNRCPVRPCSRNQLPSCRLQIMLTQLVNLRHTISTSNSSRAITKTRSHFKTRIISEAEKPRQWTSTTTICIHHLSCPTKTTVWQICAIRHLSTLVPRSMT